MELYKRDIIGVQAISYADLIRDVKIWASTLPKDVTLVAGIPRSGLTVAHILASELNVSGYQIHGKEFRQPTGRTIRPHSGKVLIVDDCCSFGGAINTARQQIDNAYFGAVYARNEGRENCGLDFWFRKHADPQWLVITEWNWKHHQDTPYIAATDDITGNSVPFHSVYNRDLESSCVIEKYEQSSAALLATAREDVLELSCTKPVLNAETFEIRHGNIWPEKVFCIGLPRTGTTSFCDAMRILGRKTLHCPSWPEELKQFEAMADLPIAANYESLKAQHPTAKFVLTVRNEDEWLRSMQILDEMPECTIRMVQEAASKVFNSIDKLECYRRHVVSACNSIPGLLKFDPSTGWEPLCRFIGEEVPDLPFPHRNHKSTSDTRLRS